MNDQATGLNIWLIKRVTKIVSAYASSNYVPLSNLRDLIEGVGSTLARLSSGSPMPSDPIAGKPTPAQIASSITPDALISFIDGRSYQMLKRHLTRNGLDPSSYRARFGLPVDYPMVAPSYGARRTEISRKISLKRLK